MEQRTSSPVLRRPNNGDDGPDLCWALDGGKPGVCWYSRTSVAKSR